MIEIRTGRLRFTENEGHRTLQMSAETDEGNWNPIGTVEPPAELAWTRTDIEGWLVGYFLPEASRAPIIDPVTGIEEPLDDD